MIFHPKQGRSVTLQPAIVIATLNEGKRAEIARLLKGFSVSIKSLGDVGPVPSVEEDGDTFEENAYKKASFTARVLGMPALADDSGLKVAALDGRPGVHSARYAGRHASDMDRCRKLLAEMAGVRNRRAVFACVISIAVPSGLALTYEAVCKGCIAETAAGTNGFGYDPVFYYPPFDKTFAQMTPEEKNHISHRGRALREVAGEFDRILKWIELKMPADRAAFGYK